MTTNSLSLGAKKVLVVGLGPAGYTLAQEHAFLPNQYFLVFRPA